MADFLAGSSMQSNTAPLTQAQTVQMCQHLAVEIRSVESVLNEVQRDLQHTQEHLQNLRVKSTQSYDDVHSLQVGLADTNINLDKVSKELGRVGQATQQLQVSDQDTKEKLTLLEETRKMVDTRIDAIAKEVMSTKEIDRRLQEAIERHINEDLRVLRKEVANTNLAVNQVVMEVKQSAAYGRENRDAIRDSKVDVEKVLNEVKKANTVTNILENRLASSAKGLQQSWAKCAELSDAMVKLAECYDKTKARVIDAEGVMKEISTFGRQTQSGLDEAMRQVEQNTDRVTISLKSLGDNSSAIEDVRHQLNAVRQGQQNGMRQVTSLKNELVDVKQTAYAVQGALKEQSSMMLPSIQAEFDSPQASKASTRPGNSLTSSHMSSSPGRPESRKTPRGR